MTLRFISILNLINPQIQVNKKFLKLVIAIGLTKENRRYRKTPA